MRLLVVGSGDAFNAGGRGHACYWLDGAGRAPLMIDFGATALMALKRLGRDPRELGAIALTHLHGDHLGGFPFLILDGMYSLLRSEPLEVLGPVGVRERIDQLMRATYQDVIDRPRPYELRWRELLPGDRTELLGARMDGFPAEHMDPPERPLCLRVTGLDGKVVAFSGDTALCDGLLAAAAGADLLVAECSALRPPAGRHCTWEEWRQVLPKVGAKRVLFTHLGADVRAEIPQLLQALPPECKVAFADDGMVIEL